MILGTRTFAPGALRGHLFVVVFACVGDKWLYARHKARVTWETAGGHIEQGETPEQAALRELYEETGARAASIRRVMDYFSWDDVGSAAGAVFLAEVSEIGPLPESEMAEARLFDLLPDSLTYPGITPILYAEILKQEDTHHA